MPEITNFDSLDESTKAEMAKLGHSLLTDPKTRKKMLRLVKEKNPEIPVPEVDMEDTLQQRLDSIEKTFKDRDEAERKRKADEKIESGRKMFTEAGFEDKDREAIEKGMIEGAYPNDYQKALNLAKKERDLAKPTAIEPDLGVFTLPKFDGLQENPREWGLREAHKAIDEIEKARRP